MARVTPPRPPRLGRLTKCLIGAGLLAVTGAALADPFTLIAAVTIELAGITGLQALAVYTGAALMSNTMARRKQARAAAAARAQYNASLQDRNVTVLSAEAPWQVVYGNPAPIGGALVNLLASGDRDEYGHLQIVFASHQCESLDEVYIDGEPIGLAAVDGSGWVTEGEFVETPTKTITELLTFDGSGNATATHAPTRILAGVVNSESTTVYTLTSSGTAVSGGPVSSTLYVSYEYTDNIARVNVQVHLSPAGVDTVDAFVMARCPDKLTAADKLSGFTYIWLTLDKNMARFQGGPPQVSAKLHGKLIYDWRTTTTVYSNNPALCTADFVMSEAGFGATLASIDSTCIIAAANAADTAGFTCDGAFQTSQAREATKQQLEDSFAGACYQSGGVWRIAAGAWSASVMTLTDADAAAPIQIVQASYSGKERYNTCRGTYIEGSGLGVSADFTPYVNATYITADGSEHALDVSFPFTKDHQSCQNLARILVERSRGGLVIDYPGKMRLWPLQPGDRVAITNAEFGWSAKTFRVTDWGFHPHAPVSPQLIEDVAAFYDAAATSVADSTPNTNLPSPFAGVSLANLAAASGTAQLLIQSDGTVQTRVLVSWAATASSYVASGGRVQVQWRTTSATDDAWQSTQPLDGDATSTWIGGVPDGTQILLRARFVNQLGVAGDWATIAHRVVGKTEPPPDITSFSVNADGVATWTAVVAADLAGYLLRWQPGSNTSWGDATPLHEGILTDSPYSIGIRPSGTSTYMVKAVDTSGNQSATAAASVVALGDPIVANVVTSYNYKTNDWPGTYSNATVSGGNLVADADASPAMWDVDPLTAMWTLGTDAMWDATTYKAVTYTLPVFVVASADDGAQLTLQNTIAADAYVIEYRRDGDAPLWTSDSAAFWTSDAAAFWAAAESYRPWPGSVTASAGRYEWRITTQSMLTQTIISALTAQLDVADQVENCGQVTVLAAGTVIPTTKTWRAVTGIGLTLVADGGTARAARVETLATRTVTTRDSSNAAVDGTVLATLQGY